MEIVSKNDCITILDNLKSKPSQKLLEYELCKFSEQVLGFLAEHYALNITFEDGNDLNKKKTHRFFVKSLPRNNVAHSDYLKAFNVFAKEIAVYKNLINEFSKLASAKFAPEYYFSRNDQLLVLEDVAKCGFQVRRSKYLDKDTTKSALETLSKFHAASIILEEKNSTKSSQYRIDKYFTLEVTEKTFAFSDGNIRYQWLMNTSKCLEDLSEYFTNNNKISSKIRDFIFSEKGFRNFIKPSSKYRNVLCHDDLWCNNLMFNDKNRCLLVDFQLTRYTPPIFDVLLLLYLNLEMKNLTENLSEYLQHYYNSMRDELRQHEIDIEKIIPGDDFIESVKIYKLPVLIECGLYGTNVYLSNELSKTVISDMEVFEKFYFKDRSYFIVNEFKSNPKFRERYTQVLIPLYELFENL